MSRKDVTIDTPEGVVRAYLFTPDKGEGPWPAALMYMDALAIRPVLFEMGERLASQGYAVLLPDMFWRLGDYEPLNATEMLTVPEKTAELFGKYIPSTDATKSMADTKAFLAWLDEQPEVNADKVGVFGYCMGGAIALRAAGTFPDKIAAAAAFHAGFVAHDGEDSPHLVVPNIKGKVLVAGADDDPYYDEAQAKRLEAAFAGGGVDVSMTIYKGALHGYTMTDLPVYNEEAAERHWKELVELLDGVLK